MKAWLVLLLLVGAGALLLLRGSPDLLAGLGTGEIVTLIAGLLLAGLYIVSLVNDGQTRPIQAMRYALIWLTLGFGLIAGYSYRDDLAVIANRVGGELLPSGQIVSVESGEGETAVRVRKRLDGHFAVRAAVNGQSMSLMVDTGASAVVLRPADAERAGIDVDALSYTVPVDTANGTTYAAAVRLRTLAVGPLTVRNVDALVAKPGTVKENLLGMSFLRRLRSYEFANDYLTLRG